MPAHHKRLHKRSKKLYFSRWEQQEKWRRVIVNKFDYVECISQSTYTWPNGHELQIMIFVFRVQLKYAVSVQILCCFSLSLFAYAAVFLLSFVDFCCFTNNIVYVWMHIYLVKCAHAIRQIMFHETQYATTTSNNNNNNRNITNNHNNDSTSTVIFCVFFHRFKTKK